MGLFLKLRSFFFLNTKSKLLFIEAYLLLGWARILKIFPFSIVAPSLGEYMNETSHYYNGENKEIIRKVSHVIHITSKYTFWESQCLVKAIAGMKMLERRSISSTLYLGTSKDETGKMIAHAWLRSGPFYISGAEGKGNFTIVGMFAKRNINNHKEGDTYE